MCAAPHVQIRRGTTPSSVSTVRSDRTTMTIPAGYGDYPGRRGALSTEEAVGDSVSSAAAVAYPELGAAGGSRPAQAVAARRATPLPGEGRRGRRPRATHRRVT